LRRGEKQKDRERTMERERARKSEIKTTEHARNRKGQGVRCDTDCTHKYPVARGYHTPLLTRPDSTSSLVFICRETKYFLGRR